MELLSTVAPRVCGHGIEPRATPRMAANEPTKGEPAPDESAVPLQRLRRVLRASRRIAAGLWQEWREEVAVEGDDTAKQ
jgi:hypothetical protein